VTANEQLTEKLPEIETLCRRYHVRRLRLFGSALRGDWDPESSDFDFLVEYLPEVQQLGPLDRLVGLQVELEKLLGRRVDVVNLNTTKNPYFRERAESQAQETYAV
jgi:hypothetical protein